MNLSSSQAAAAAVFATNYVSAARVQKAIGDFKDDLSYLKENQFISHQLALVSASLASSSETKKNIIFFSNF